MKTSSWLFIATGVALGLLALSSKGSSDTPTNNTDEGETDVEDIEIEVITPVHPIN